MALLHSFNDHGGVPARSLGAGDSATPDGVSTSHCAQAMQKGEFNTITC